MPHIHEQTPQKHAAPPSPLLSPASRRRASQPKPQSPQGPTCSACHGLYTPSSSSSTPAPTLHPVSTCGHGICTPCLASAVLAPLSSSSPASSSSPSFSCPTPSCSAPLTGPDVLPHMAAIESSETFSDASDLVPDLGARLAAAERKWVLASGPPGVISCPNPDCGFVFEQRMTTPAKARIVPPTPARVRNEEGVPLSADAHAHHRDYRHRCRDCATVFCAGCMAVPYHTGYTCDGAANAAAAASCRFCGDTLVLDENWAENNTDSPALDNVCTSRECIYKRAISCRVAHPCGHACIGVKREKECLPCLEPECASEPHPSITADDYCSICWVDDLRSAPCISLACGHVFHYSCVTARLDARWPTPHISFEFMGCPLCSEPISHRVLSKRLKPLNRLRSEVLALASHLLRNDRLADQIPKDDDENNNEDDNNDDAIDNPKEEIVSSADVEAFAASQTFYLCSTCHHPYHGGAVACGPAADAGEGANPEDHVCPPCKNPQDTSGASRCPQHGTRYIQHKCRFCCNLATYFCWGTTHFCESCHAIAPVIARKPFHELPSCSCDRIHPPQGIPHSYGCSMCHALKDAPPTLSKAQARAQAKAARKALKAARKQEKEAAKAAKAARKAALKAAKAKAKSKSKSKSRSQSRHALQPVINT